MNLFFDTETTGKANFKADYTHPDQPRLVQLGCVLADDDGNVSAQVEFIVKPDEWIIPDEAAAIHGITHDYATRCGLPIKMVLSCFNMFCRRAANAVAHNLQFDYLVMQAAYHQQRLIFDCAAPKWQCTMLGTKPILKLPGQYRDYKWPSLAEAHQFFCGSDFDGAHSALADTLACMRIYYAWQQHHATEKEVIQD